MSSLLYKIHKKKQELKLFKLLSPFKLSGKYIYKNCSMYNRNLSCYSIVKFEKIMVYSMVFLSQVNDESALYSLTISYSPYTIVVCYYKNQ